MNKLNVKKEKGFTLIEILIVVAIISVILGLFVGGRYISSWWQGKGESDYVNQAVSCARTTWQSSKFTGITLPILVNNNCFPEKNVTGKGTTSASAFNVFSADYVISSATVNATDDSLSITTSNVPSGSCNAFVNGVQSLVSQIEVDGTTVKAPNGLVDNAILSIACSANDIVSIEVIATKTGS